MANPDHIEIELCPIEHWREPATRALFAPSPRLNCGFAPGSEVVVEGRVIARLALDRLRAQSRQRSR